MNTVTKTVALQTGIQRGETVINTVDVRKPKTGELRGTRLLDLAQMDVTAITTVLPRVTIPAVTEAELRNMDPADFTLLATEVALFLAPTQESTESQ